jgi:nucleotide-binding universal stress UspA family protein
MFKHLLVPLDGSALAEAVLPFLGALARAFPASATLIRVLEKVQVEGCTQPVDPLEWQMCKAEAESYLQRMQRRTQDLGLRTETALLEGDPAQRITEFIHSRSVDLLVASSHGRSGFTGWNTGGVIQKVINRARISILIVPVYKPAAASGEWPFRRVMVPLDGSRRSECVLPPLMRLHRAHPLELLLTHVVRVPEMPRRPLPSPSDRELAERIVRRNQEEAAGWLESLRATFDGSARVHLQVSEDVAACLHDLVQDEKVDLVVLSAHGFAGKSRWTYGSTASSFLGYGTAPLLIIQDVPAERVAPSEAETAAAEIKGH